MTNEGGSFMPCPGRLQRYVQKLASTVRALPSVRIPNRTCQVTNLCAPQRLRSADVAYSKQQVSRVTHSMLSLIQTQAFAAQHACTYYVTNCI